MDYRIGVQIILANGVSNVLAIISKDLLKFKGGINEIEKGFAAWKPSIVAAGLALGGAGLLGVVDELAKKAAAFQDSLTKVSQLSPATAALVNSGAIQGMSYKLGNQLGMKVEDVSSIYGGVYGAIQDPNEALALTPFAAKYARLQQLRHPGSHPEEGIRTLVKAGELSGRIYDDKGKIDADKVKEWFDMVAIVEAATHGQVNGDVLYGMAKQAGPGSLRGLSKEGIEHMMIMSQELGGGPAGTALLSLRNQFTGQMLKRSAVALQKYGMLQDGEWSSEGGHVTMTDAATKRLFGSLQNDPVAFVDNIVSHLEAMGITDKNEQMRAVNEMIGRQTSQRLVQDIMAQRQQIDRETHGLDQGATVDQALAGYDGNYNANLQAFTASWDNLMTALGGPAIQLAVPAMKAMTELLNSFNAAATKHPTAIKYVLEGIVAISAGMIGAAVGIAGFLAFTLGMPALIAGAAVGLVAALGTLVFLNWHSITEGVTSAGRGISNFAALSWEKIKDMFTGIGNAISGFIDKIAALYNRIKDWFVAPAAPGAKPPTIDDQGLLHLNSFHPGVDAPRAQQASFLLNVDGRQLAQSVIDHIESIYGQATGAPSADGMSSPFGVDRQFSTT
jgi:hypothetical protein